VALRRRAACIGGFPRCAMEAMMKMIKIDIAEVEKAAGNA
jgi:hypothetical protein